LNALEIINECFVLITSLLLFTFTDLVSDDQKAFKEVIGDVMLGIIFFSMGINILVAIKIIGSKVVRWCRKKCKSQVKKGQSRVPRNGTGIVYEISVKITSLIHLGNVHFGVMNKLNRTREAED